MDLLNDKDQHDFTGQTYRQFAASLIGCQQTENVEAEAARFLKVDEQADIINRLRWLGFFQDEPVAIDKGSILDAFVSLLLKKMSYAPGETDMTIVHVEIVAEFADRREKRSATMVVDGTPNGDSAMSRAVALPAAMAARMLIEGRLVATGVQMPPTLPELYPPLLTELAEHGFAFDFKTKVLP